MRVPSQIPFVLRPQVDLVWSNLLCEMGNTSCGFAMCKAYRKALVGLRFNVIIFVFCIFILPSMRPTMALLLHCLGSVVW